MEILAKQILLNKKALVFSGGGIYGIGITGSLKKLEELGYDFNNVQSVSGSSVGSILSLGIACKASVDYMVKKINQVNLPNLADRDCILTEGIRLLRKFGVRDMEEVDEFIISILEDLGFDKDITFQELYEKTNIHLTITYLSINYGRTIFADYINEPNSLVRKTVLKSCSIPIFYEAFSKGKGSNKTLDCDGGTIALTPSCVPRRQGWNLNEILIFNFTSPNDKELILNGSPGQEIEFSPSPTNIVDFLYTFIQILRKHAILLYSNPEDDMITVKINIGSKLTSTSFDMTESEKEWLFNQGQIAVGNYLEELTQLVQEGKI
jgi:predicted acylesterase/phospholipase RssA